MSAEKGGYTDAENHKSKRNWGLALGVLTAFVSVPAALLFVAYSGYQHIKGKEKSK